MNSKSNNSENVYKIINDILESVSEIIFVLDDKFNIKLATDSFCELMNTNLRSILNKPLSKINPGQWDQQKVQNALDKIRNGKKSSADIELKIDLGAGRARFLTVNFRRISFSGEQLIFGTIKKLVYPKNLAKFENHTDTQALKLAQFSIEHAPDAVYWMNREGKFTYVNEQACLLLGYSRQEFSGLTLWDIDLNFPKETWDQAWQRKENNALMNNEHVMTWHRCKSGLEIPVEVAARHITFAGYEFHVAFVRDISERKEYEKALKITQSAIDNASIACFWINNEGKVAYANAQACDSLGYSNTELQGMSVADIDPDFSLEKWQNCWNEIRIKKAKLFETRHKRKDGTVFPVEITANYIEYENECYSCVYARDLSQYKQAEEEKAELEMQLYQAQKMETVGRLAGGIAHDFNNMLSVILGYTEMLKERFSHDPDAYEDLVQIEKASNHSKDITRQLLAFSRKQIIAPRPVNINDLIENTRRTLIRLIGENIELQFLPQNDIWTINFDPAQLDQILVNLVVNAKDAMEAGGSLTIKTENVHADSKYCADNVEVESGEYVLLTVHDTGIGIDNETLSYIFEPFFTTKSVDQGTGLGLATVYGIVMQNNGFISVQSEQGVGTVFKIHLPRYLPKSLEKEENKVSAPISRDGTGTILLVEDDDMLRRMTTVMLEDIGYKVYSASSPIEALSIFKDNRNGIDMLMTDVVMPEMSGVELKEEINKINPDIRALFMSGYTSHVIVDDGILEEGVHFIQKPFSMNDLNKLVREAMGIV